MRATLLTLTGIFTLFGALMADAAETLALAEFERRVETNGALMATFSLEGTVCAVGPKWIVLRDESGAVALELPGDESEWVPGDRLRISGDQCIAVRGKHALRVGTAPLIDNDGHHSEWERTGSIRLDRGNHAFRLEYFNGLAECMLDLEIEGPDLPRQKVTGSFFQHLSEDGQRLEPGLSYSAFEGRKWTVLPDFSKLRPIKEGIVDGPSCEWLTRPEHAGLLFTGMIRLEREGDYRFFLRSDDGSRLWLGRPRVKTELLAEAGDPDPTRWEGGSEGIGRWVKMEGSVTFAAWNEGLMMLELQGRGGTTDVVADVGPQAKPESWLHRRIELTGLARADGILVVDASNLHQVEPEESGNGGVVEIDQIRRLKPEEAARAKEVTIRGVVTMAAPEFLVIQDVTGGVYVRYASTDSVGHPQVGEVWELHGVTDPGDFSPVVRGEDARYQGRAPIPRVVRPSWDQIVSGSLDAEMVEIEGAIVSVDDLKMVLLTRDGDLTLNFSHLYPPPFDEIPADEVKALVGSVVRVRGVFTATWSWDTGQVIAGNIYLGNSEMSVEAPASEDPFTAPRVDAADLLLFTSHTSRFRRIRVPGTVLYVQGPEVFLDDAAATFKAVSDPAVELSPGDRVEVAGYPRLGGPSPVLMDARFRMVSKRSLPRPKEISPSDLPDDKLDASRVELVATVLSDSPREQGRVLELRCGEQRFIARIPESRNASDSLEPESTVKVVGVYVAALSQRTDPFELLVADPGDLTVLSRGPWWTTRHTVILLSTLLALLLSALAWVRGLRRTVAHRTHQLAEEIEGRQIIEHHREMERERTRVARDLHDELGSKLTEAGILTALIKRPDVPESKKSGYLEQLDDVCHGLVTGLDEIVWAVNPAYDSVNDLAGYFSMFAQRFLELAGIRCRLHIEDSVRGYPLEAARRHELFLAFKESLTNVVRHSGASEVSLRIGVRSGDLEVIVADNGCGFEEGLERPGSDGLNGMSARMESIGGHCQIIHGKGTTVRFLLKLNPESE